MSRLAVALDALREAQADAPEELVRLLLGAEFDAAVNGGCRGCGVVFGDLSDPRAPPHQQDCRFAYWLRVFGGATETQRQVNAAHEAALSEGVERNSGFRTIGPEDYALAGIARRIVGSGEQEEFVVRTAQRVYGPLVSSTPKRRRR